MTVKDAWVNSTGEKNEQELADNDASIGEHISKKMGETKMEETTGYYPTTHRTLAH